MDSEHRIPAASPTPQSTSLPPRKSRLATFRATLQGRRGRIFYAALFFLSGLLFGIIFIFVLLFAISPDNSAIPTPVPPSTSDIVVQVGRTYITHIVSGALQSSGLPGSIQNVQVTFATGDSATITGNDTISVLGIGTTRHFTIVLQPYVAACQVHIHVLHIDLDGITVTSFASLFESQINSQIQVNTSKLPRGFTYCTTSVHTGPQGVYVTYSAKPVAYYSSPSTSLRRRVKNSFMYS